MTQICREELTRVVEYFSHPRHFCTWRYRDSHHCVYKLRCLKAKVNILWSYCHSLPAMQICSQICKAPQRVCLFVFSRGFLSNWQKSSKSMTKKSLCFDGCRQRVPRLSLLHLLDEILQLYKTLCFCIGRHLTLVILISSHLHSNGSFLSNAFVFLFLIAR